MWIGRSWVRRPSTIGTQAGGRVAVGVRDRLVAAVAARHHERARRRRDSRRWCSGEYGRNTPRSGRPGATDGGAPTSPRGAGQMHDRPSRRDERRRSRRRPGRTSRGRVEVGHHHREGLVVARLAARGAPGPASVVGRVDREVVAADALDPDDRTVCERGDRRVERVVAVGERCAGRRRARRAAARTSGQALGWAWKRRSAGRRTPPGTPGTSSNPAIVVAGRSYGTRSMIV